jgi:ribonuclease P protein component
VVFPWQRHYPPGVDERPYTFRRTHRLGTKLGFSRVYDARVRESRGPLTVYGLPNELGHPRLGLSVSRKVGTAVRRNRIKRLLREAFRMHQYDLPAGYDLVFVVRPHEPLALAEYQKLMTHLMLRMHKAWEGRPAS